MTKRFKQIKLIVTFLLTITSSFCFFEVGGYSLKQAFALQTITNDTTIVAKLKQKVGSLTGQAEGRRNGVTVRAISIPVRVEETLAAKKNGSKKNSFVWVQFYNSA